MYILIAGGGKVGFHLAEELLREIHEVLVLERVGARANQVREEIFRDLGLETFSPTSFGAQIMVEMLHKEPVRK